MREVKERGKKEGGVSKGKKGRKTRVVGLGGGRRNEGRIKGGKGGGHKKEGKKGKKSTVLFCTKITWPWFFQAFFCKENVNCLFHHQGRCFLDFIAHVLSSVKTYVYAKFQ